MSEIELQQYLIKNILEIHDTKILLSIISFLNSESFEKSYELNENEKLFIAASREDIKNGKFIEHEQFFNELEAWLNEK